MSKRLEFARKCIICGETKEANDFYVSASATYRRLKKCKVCVDEKRNLKNEYGLGDLEKKEVYCWNGDDGIYCSYMGVFILCGQLLMISQIIQ